ncbi:hypothetical protein B0H34DRAFT_723737 [Crassisporium funariophilum]|nr:hypothetical protein B0H34DRAFT_723737 [Crassisporium funariophilum]
MESRGQKTRREYKTTSIYADNTKSTDPTIYKEGVVIKPRASRAEIVTPSLFSCFPSCTLCLTGTLQDTGLVRRGRSCEEKRRGSMGGLRGPRRVN